MQKILTTSWILSLERIRLNLFLKEISSPNGDNGLQTLTCDFRTEIIALGSVGSSSVSQDVDTFTFGRR